MNDTELDQILDKWRAPAAPASLRENMRAGFAVSHETTAGVWPRRVIVFARRSLLAGAILVTGAFLLLLVAQAFPQTLGLSPPVKIPYIVESEFVRYLDDGTARVAAHLTSYNDNGREVILSMSFAGDPIGNVIRQIQAFWRQLTQPFAVNTERKEPSAQARAEFVAALIRAGCAQGEVLGHETILNHQTVASQGGLRNGRRLTVWRAPDLECYPLRVDTEEQRPDGTFRLVSRQQALKVTVNP
jgi:hypothetical protein